MTINTTTPSADLYYCHFHSRYFKRDDIACPECIKNADKFKPKTKTDDFNPSYYASLGDYEPIKVIKAWKAAYNIGVLLAYIARAGNKPGEDKLKDLKKAQWHLNKEIEWLEEQEKNVLSQHQAKEI